MGNAGDWESPYTYEISSEERGQNAWTLTVQVGESSPLPGQHFLQGEDPEVAREG